MRTFLLPVVIKQDRGDTYRVRVSIYLIRMANINEQSYFVNDCFRPEHLYHVTFKLATSG
jgi:hypothetical protein